jgi:hypothetical protein
MIRSDPDRRLCDTGEIKTVFEADSFKDCANVDEI